MTKANTDDRLAEDQGSEGCVLAQGSRGHAEPLEFQDGGGTWEGHEDPQQRVQRLVLGYAEELRQERVLVDAEPPRRRMGMLWWGLVIVSVILPVAVLTVALLQPESEAAEASRLRETNLCGQHQATVMRAIGRYTRDHGQPPQDLAALQPGYLTEPPVDPASGLPYRYTVQGDIAWLSCPKHLLPPPRSSS